MQFFTSSRTLFIAHSLLLGSNVLAASPVDNFATCLVDNLNGKERKALPKWLFFAMASHPEIKAFSKISTQDTEASDQNVAALVTRLLTENCPAELKVAHKANPQAIEKGFELVGQVAMQELMSNGDVNSTIMGYSKYIDENKLASILVD